MSAEGFYFLLRKEEGSSNAAYFFEEGVWDGVEGVSGERKTKVGSIFVRGDYC